MISFLSKMLNHQHPFLMCSNVLVQTVTGHNVSLQDLKIQLDCTLNKRVFLIRKGDIVLISKSILHFCCACAKQHVNHSAYKLCLILGTLYVILYHIANSVLIVVHGCLLSDLLPPDSAKVPWEVTERKKSLIWLDTTVEGH